MKPDTAKPTYEITVDDGKYTFQVFPLDDRIHILRCGEPWVQLSQGSKAILALMAEFEEVKGRMEGLEK